MPITGNTYGTKVARVGVPVLLALDFGGGVTVYDASILAVLEDGSPVIGRNGGEPSPGYTFAATSDVDDVEAMLSNEWTWPLNSRSIVGISSAAAAADVSAIPADGWKTVHSTTYTTVGGTSLSIQWTVVADVAVGGKVRILFAGVQVGQEVALDALSSAQRASFVGVPVPITASPGTEYTVAIQVQAVGLLSSVTVNAASAPTVNGARIALVEYH